MKKFFLLPFFLIIFSGCATDYNVVPQQSIVQQNTVASTSLPNTTLCNGVAYTECPAGQSFVCPKSGDAYCQPPVKQNQDLKNIKSTVPQAKIKTDIPKQSQTNVITNSQPCLEIASGVVKNSSLENIKVLQAHFKQSTNNCYYELQYVINGDTMTSIHYAPYDEIIATCAKISGACYQSGKGDINESIFHLIEAQYLAN